MEKQSNTNNEQTNNPLHGVKLKDLLEYLLARYGWENLAERFPFRCFTHDPSINSSLKFLRKNEWARKKVEVLYGWSIEKDRKKKERE